MIDQLTEGGVFSNVDQCPKNENCFVVGIAVVLLQLKRSWVFTQLEKKDDNNRKCYDDTVRRIVYDCCHWLLFKIELLHFCL